MRIATDDPVAKKLDGAAAKFDAWREEHDPMHDLPIEQAAQAYYDHAMKQK